MLCGVFSIQSDRPDATPAGSLYRDKVPEWHGQDKVPPDDAERAFIAGPENGLLKAYRDALSDEPRYNPVLLFGTTGVGKSHLLRLFCGNYLARHPAADVLSLTGADFARGFAAALELNAIDEYRSKHRQLDLLILDDLHELNSQTAAQQELLHTIDNLIDRRAQVLLASSVCPTESDWMIPSLTSRLCFGLTIPIAKPSAETRRELLSQLATQKGIQLSDSVVDEILHDRDTESVAQLTSVLLELVELNEPSPDKATTRRILEKRISRTNVSPRQIIRHVARYFRLKSADLIGVSRHRSTVRARGAAIYLVRRMTGISFEQLGRHFGNRDHSTALHAYRRTEEQLHSDPLIRKAIQDVTQRLGTGGLGAGAQLY